MSEIENSILTNQFVEPGPEFETQTTFFQNLDLEQGILFLNRVIVPPAITFPSITELQKEEITNLMTKWNLQFLTPILIKECIDIETLQMLTEPEVMQMLRHVPLGYRAKFRNYLQLYKRNPSLNVQVAEPVEKCVQNTSENNTIELRNVLKLTFHGRNILSYYNQHKFITETHRKDLRDSIYTYVIDENIKWSLPLAEALSEQIVELFPTEIKEVYFNKTNKKVGGILFYNFYNFKRSITLPNSAEQIRNKSQSLLNNADEPSDSLNTGADFEEHLNALNGSTPCTWAEVEIHWQATSATRTAQFKKSNTEDAFFKWPQYKEKLGFKLIDIDFKELYPNATPLAEVFSNIQTDLMEIYATRIKDGASKKLFKQLQANWDKINHNSKACIMFYLLPSLIIPTTRKVSKDQSGEQSVKKISIKDSQESLVTVIKSVTGIESYIQLKKETKKPIQPLIIIEEDLFCVNSIITFIDNVKFRHENFLEAIDITFKIFHVFNIKYPDETEVLWNFVQHFFYNIKTTYDIKSSAVTQLIADLKHKS